VQPGREADQTDDRAPERPQPRARGARSAPSRVGGTGPPPAKARRHRRGPPFCRWRNWRARARGPPARSTAGPAPGSPRQEARARGNRRAGRTSAPRKISGATASAAAKRSGSPSGILSTGWNGMSSA
jgi:hypothetical protein